ncbi:hypothetical protein FCH28_31565 [Streptomyces piniterrae]|uniref:Tat pathway signal sequence domain protein n=1 Tax=Streptomyces piniterrae TaxID=2571125 RepID=A0A4U0MT44_9ACTN|nr:hypothetical protein [Streptomyces piniterrae]TJZ44137.1 hypothetical protein FCH28_31565 [Streptomyces piniterrae]
MTYRHSRLRALQLAATAGVALLALTACNDGSSAGRDDAGSQNKAESKDAGGHSASPSPSGAGSPEATSAPSSPGTGSTAPTDSAAPTGSTASAPDGPRTTSNDKRVKVLKCADSTATTTLLIDNSAGSDVDLPLTIKVRIVDGSGGLIETDKAFVSVPPGETKTKSVKMNFTNRASEVARCEVHASVY